MRAQCNALGDLIVSGTCQPFEIGQCPSQAHGTVGAAQTQPL